MKKNSNTPFTPTRYRYPSGTIAWKVEGLIKGTRYRAFCPTKAEADVDAEKRRAEAAQDECATHSVSVPKWMTYVFMVELIALCLRLKDMPRSLKFYVEWALANFKEPNRQVTLKTAVEGFLAWCDKNLRPATAGGYRRYLRRVVASFGETTPLCEITTDRLRKLFQMGNPKKKTFNNRRGVLHRLFEWAAEPEQDWSVQNPVLAIRAFKNDQVDAERDPVAIFSPQEVADLFEFLETWPGHKGVLVPYFALCIFAGIRPCHLTGEIQRLEITDIELGRPFPFKKLDPRLRAGTITVPAKKAKTKKLRYTPMSRNLVAWLLAYPLSKFPIIPVNLSHLLASPELKRWRGHDKTRHTAISAFLGIEDSFGIAGRFFGAKEEKIEKHYFKHFTSAESDRFYRILPKHRAIPAGPSAASVATFPPTAIADAA